LDRLIALAPDAFPIGHERFIHFFKQLFHLKPLDGIELNVIAGIFFKSYLGMEFSLSEFSHFCNLKNRMRHEKYIQVHQIIEIFYSNLIGLGDCPQLFNGFSYINLKFLDALKLLEFPIEEIKLGKLILENAEDFENVHHLILSVASRDFSFNDFLLSIYLNDQTNLKVEFSNQKSLKYLIKEFSSSDSIIRLCQTLILLKKVFSISCPIEIYEIFRQVSHPQKLQTNNLIKIYQSPVLKHSEMINSRNHLISSDECFIFQDYRDLIKSLIKHNRAEIVVLEKLALERFGDQFFSIIVPYFKTADQNAFRMKISEFLQDNSPIAFLLRQCTISHPLHAGAIIRLADYFLEYPLLIIFSQLYFENRSSLLLALKRIFQLIFPLLAQICSELGPWEMGKFEQVEPFLSLFTRCFFGHFELVDWEEAFIIVSNLKYRALLTRPLGEYYGINHPEVLYLCSEGLDPLLIKNALKKLGSKSPSG
jgi:hypothetical protein